MIIILGVVSYSRSSSALNENYEAAVSQAMNMAKECFSFVFSNIESDMNVYLSDSELTAYYSGKYSTSEAQEKSLSDLKQKYEAASSRLDSLKEGSAAYHKAYKEMVESREEFEDLRDFLEDTKTTNNETYKSLNASVSNKTAANPFIGNIYIFKDGSDTISSQTALRSKAESSSEEEESEVDPTKLYKEFIKLQLGQQVTSDTANYHWCGPVPELDKLLSVSSDDYILRVAHDMSSTSDAVMVVDIKKDAITNILQNLNLGEGSFVGIITADKQELAVNGKALTAIESGEEQKEKAEDSVSKDKIFVTQDFYEKALKSDTEYGSDYVRSNGTTYLFTYQKIGSSGVMLCSLVPESIIVAQANSIRILTIVLILISCLIAMVVGTLISKGFSRSINKSIKELEKVSKGDFTVEFRTSRRDEFALLYGSCNDMLANIRGLIMEVESIYDALTVSLNKVDSSSTTFSETTKDIQRSVHEVETGVGEQTESAGACLDQMDNLFTKINTVKDNTTQIGEIAVSTENAIQELSVHSANIGQIVNSINDIAEETNLLSLNASIEAARAGNAGKGFSVVASQIRKLADQCLVSAGKITNIVNQITESTQDAVHAAQTAEEIVNEQAEAVAATSQSFHTLKLRIEKLSENLTSIQSSSTDMENTGSSTLHAMENISAILDETLASITSVASVTDKQSEVLGSLNEASSQLMTRAQRLGDAISKFKTQKTEE